MNTKNINHGFMLLLSCMMLAEQPVQAAPDEAMARAQFMIRQISAERDQLQTDKAGLKQQLDALQKKYDGLESKSTRSSGDMKQQIAQLRTDLEAERKAHDLTREQLAAVITEKNSLTDVTATQAQNIELCIANNHKLYDINRTMLGKYEDKGVLDSLMQSNPVTGLTQVEIENLIDDTQYKLDDLRINKDLMTDTKIN